MAQSFKVIVVGESGTGKTAIIQRLINNTFRSESQATVGVEFKSFNCEIDGKPTKLQIWDTAGQEKSKSVAKSYFRNAVGALLVYDVTDRHSYEEVEIWLSDIQCLSHPNSVIILVGNKTDLMDTRVIGQKEAEYFAERHGILYIETSAKDGSNVQDTFLNLAREIYNKVNSGSLILPTLKQQPAMLYTDPNKKSDATIHEDSCNC